MATATVTKGTLKICKAPVKPHHENNNSQFLQAGCNSCHPTNSVKALKEETTEITLIKNCHYITALLPRVN